MSEMHLGHWRKRDLDGGSLKKDLCSLYPMPVSSNAVPRHNIASVWQIDRNLSLSVFCLVEHKSLKHSVLLMREQAVLEGNGGVCIRSEIWWDPGQQSRVTGKNPFKSSEHDIWEWQSPIMRIILLKFIFSTVWGQEKRRSCLYTSNVLLLPNAKVFSFAWVTCWKNKQDRSAPDPGLCFPTLQHPLYGSIIRSASLNHLLLDQTMSFEKKRERHLESTFTLEKNSELL